MVQNNNTSMRMTDIHDIKPLEKIGFDPFLFHYILYVLLGVVLVVLLITLFLYLKKRKKNNARRVAFMTPDEAALKAMDDLTEQINADGKAFYFTLSTILRRYLHGRFDIGSLEMTTEELLPDIDQLDIHPELKSKFRKFLISSDPIKFANYPAFQEKMENDLLFARNFVEQTTPSIENG